MTSHAIFEDTSTDCAICLESLYGTDDNDNDSDGDHQHENDEEFSNKQSIRVITLGCGHKWHLNCILQQLQISRPNSTKRLLFHGCQCAKCGVICTNHDDLQRDNLVRSTDILRRKVDTLLEEHVAMDIPEAWSRSNGDSRIRKEMIVNARRKYAFYLCRHCEEPYFGGTVECADQHQHQHQHHQQVADNDTDDNDDREEERLCTACTPHSQTCCKNPLEHSGYLVWKCRYCCQISTHVCYGNVHFCDDCHDRNSRRVQHLSERRRERRQPPPSLESITCSGTDCPYPKRVVKGTTNQRETHHKNGSTSDCEHVYGCVWCQSSEERRQQVNIVEEVGSHNLLFNSNGQHHLQGWNQLNPRISWQVEKSDTDLPIAVFPGAATTTNNNATTNNNNNTNFVSSFLPCVMSQTLDLSKMLQSPCEDITLEISARYRGRTDCPSVFRMEVILTGDNDDGRFNFSRPQQQHIPHQRHPPLQRLTTPTLETPADMWERSTLILRGVALPHARYLTVILIGKDSRFWQGNFGAKVKECSVRVLGENYTDKLLDDQDNVDIISIHGNNNNNQRSSHPHPIREENSAIVIEENHETSSNLVFPLLAREVILPIVCFIFFAWWTTNT